VADEDFWAGHRSNWNEDPQLVDPEIGHSSNDLAHHGPTGSIVASYSVRGRWSNAGLEQLCTCLDFALPGRHSRRVIAYGNARFTIFLGVKRGYLRPDHLSDIDETARCAAWAFDYAALTEQGRGVAGAGTVTPLPEPAPQLAEAFHLAELDLGDRFPNVYDTRTYSWSQLRHSVYLDLRHLLYYYYNPR